MYQEAKGDILMKSPFADLVPTHIDSPKNSTPPHRLRIDPLKAPAVALGVIGAFLVASPSTSLRTAGFICWLVGNLLWVVSGLRTKDWYITILFGFYFISAGLGLFWILCR